MKKKNVRNSRPKKSASAGPPAKLSLKVAPVEKKTALPVASFKGSKTRAPKIRNSRGATIVSHTEYLFDLPGTTTFTLPANQVVVIQPGLVDSFPWLAQIAASYEMYKVRQMTFHYRTRQATSNAGAVYMAFQNDSEDDIFGTKQELMAYEGSQENAVWALQDFKVNIADYMKKYFIRSNSLAAGTDAQIYDVGMFSVTALTGSANPTVGDVLVSYEIEFYKPKISASLGAGYYADFTASGVTNTTLVQHPFTTGLVENSSEVPAVGYFQFDAVGTTDTLTFPRAGVYILAFDINASAGVQTTSYSLSLTPGSNITIFLTRSNQGFNASDVYTAYWIIQVTNSGTTASNVLTFTGSGATGVTGWTSRFVIAQMQPGEIGAPIDAVHGHPSVRRRRRAALVMNGPAEEGKAEHKQRPATPEHQFLPEQVILSRRSGSTEPKRKF